MRGLIEFAGGFLAGLVVGYAVSVLASPRPGVDAPTRLKANAMTLVETPRRARDRVQGAVAEARRASADTRAELETTAGLRPETTATL